MVWELLALGLSVLGLIVFIVWARKESKKLGEKIRK